MNKNIVSIFIGDWWELGIIHYDKREIYHRSTDLNPGTLKKN
jgi:hypothetical protein